MPNHPPRFDFLLGGKVSNKQSLIKKRELVIYKGNKCLDCGNIFPDCCLDFDHRDPHLKAFAISRKMGLPLSELKIEVDKCDLVCKNCHAIRTLANPAVREKLSASGKGNKNGLGHKHTPETIVQMSISHKGQQNALGKHWKLSSETRAKQSAAQKKNEAKSGFLASLRTKDHQISASYAGVHARCHAKRNIINPACRLCQAQ